MFVNIDTAFVIYTWRVINYRSGNEPVEVFGRKRLHIKLKIKANKAVG
jgi:hypothetical protein